MRPETRDLEVESERVYVVYERKTGEIAHVHSVLTHRGATQITDKEAEARALAMASRFGHHAERLRVLRAEKFDGGVPHRVNLKTLELLPIKPTGPRRSAARVTAPRPRRAAPRPHKR